MTDPDSLVEQVKRSLLDRFHGKGAPITELHLCNHLGVSRGAVREALAQLDQQGLIDRQRKNGTTLRKPALKEYVDLWDVRCGFEVMSARLACSSITPEGIEKLKQLSDRRASAVSRNNSRSITLADIEFHETIIQISGNHVIRDMVRRTHLFDRIFHLGYKAPSHTPEDASNPHGHLAIIDALARRDADLAENLMKKHIQAAKKRRIESVLGKLDVFESSSS